MIRLPRTQYHLFERRMVRAYPRPFAHKWLKLRSRVNGILRKIKARTRETGGEAVGTTLETVAAQEAKGFFDHAGDRKLGQSL